MPCLVTHFLSKLEAREAMDLDQLTVVKEAAGVAYSGKHYCLLRKISDWIVLLSAAGADTVGTPPILISTYEFSSVFI